MTSPAPDPVVHRRKAELLQFPEAAIPLSASRFTPAWPLMGAKRPQVLCFIARASASKLSRLALPETFAVGQALNAWNPPG